jgi:hypothetical protein
MNNKDLALHFKIAALRDSIRHAEEIRMTCTNPILLGRLMTILMEERAEVQQLEKELLLKINAEGAPNE